ncbi:MAG: DUF3408 domain-containing protein [Muribaculum sp.]|nr:DUF3408 domain-containing protein [Muribaculum sp.]
MNKEHPPQAELPIALDAENTQQSGSIEEPTTGKTTKTGSKQKKEELEEFQKQFLGEKKIQNRHSIVIEKDTWEKLDYVVRRLGGHGSSVSAYIEAILEKHLQEYMPKVEIWRKL